MIARSESRRGKEEKKTGLLFALPLIWRLAYAACRAGGRGRGKRRKKRLPLNGFAFRVSLRRRGEGKKKGKENSMRLVQALVRSAAGHFKTPPASQPERTKKGECHPSRSRELVFVRFGGTEHCAPRCAAGQGKRKGKGRTSSERNANLPALSSSVAQIEPRAYP